MNEQAYKHATFLRRYMLRQFGDFARSPDADGIFDAVIFLESLGEKPATEKRKRLVLTTRKPRPLKRA